MITRREYIGIEKDSVFILDSYVRESVFEGYKKGIAVCSPPEFPHILNTYRIGYFTSLLQAQFVMKNEVNEHWNVYFRFNDYTGHFCYMITEFRLNETECWNQPETRRSYLTNGRLEEACLTCERSNCALEYYWDETDKQKHCIGNFRGRMPKEIRFKKGEIVEVMDGNRVFAGIIVEPPVSREFLQQCNAKKGYESWIHYSKDSYSVLECDITNKKTIRHKPLCVYVFPLRIPLSDTWREALQSAYNSFLHLEDSYEIVEIN